MYKVCYCTVVDCYCYEDGVPDRFGLPPVEVKVDVSKPFLHNSGVPESLYHVPHPLLFLFLKEHHGTTVCYSVEGERQSCWKWRLNKLIPDDQVPQKPVANLPADWKPVTISELALRISFSLMGKPEERQQFLSEYMLFGCNPLIEASLTKYEIERMKSAIEENSIPFPLIEDVFAVRTSLKAIANVFGCSIEKMKLATIKLYKVLKKL